ncbi:MAG: 4a-hydroxytetrahydrobiopterin dehydratase [Candidatus Thorarchaeota archaeon]
MKRDELAKIQCVPCRGGIPPLEDVRIREMLPIVEGWDRIKEDGYDKIRRTYKFKNFKKAMEFVNSVAEIAEEQGHHPDIFIQWNKVTFTLWTHAIKGLHDNDFIMAARIDELMVQ